MEIVTRVLFKHLLQITRFVCGCIMYIDGAIFSLLCFVSGLSRRCVLSSVELYLVMELFLEPWCISCTMTCSSWVLSELV